MIQPVSISKQEEDQIVILLWSSPFALNSICISLVYMVSSPSQFPTVVP